jgi:hypothetical protein
MPLTLIATKNKTQIPITVDNDRTIPKIEENAKR